jgi:N-acetylglucosaminyl-diphospho-decaprenol L-rhamnosyltransferase
MDEQFDDRVTVVMITRDRVAEAHRTLGVLEQLPERPRIIVVDNGSRDGTAAMVRQRHPDAVLVPLETNLGAAGRTHAVHLATTPYIAFSDDDSWWAPGALKTAAEILDAHPTLGLINGRILVGPDEHDDPICAEMADSPLPRPPGIPGTPLLGFLAGMSVVRRDAYLQVGGFDPTVRIGGEEEWFAADLAAAGWHLSYVPDVVAHHHPSHERDWHGRRRIGLRNTLWFNWARRPWRSALRRTWTVLGGAPRDRVTAAAVGDAVLGLPWVLRTRRRLPDHVEAGFRALEAPQATSTARRYVS